MASDEEILNNTAGEEATEDEVAKLMKELNLDEDLQFDDLIDSMICSGAMLRAGIIIV